MEWFEESDAQISVDRKKTCLTSQHEDLTWVGIGSTRLLLILNFTVRVIDCLKKRCFLLLADSQLYFSSLDFSSSLEAIRPRIRLPSGKWFAEQSHIESNAKAWLSPKSKTFKRNYKNFFAQFLEKNRYWQSKNRSGSQRRTNWQYPLVHNVPMRNLQSNKICTFSGKLNKIWYLRTNQVAIEGQTRLPGMLLLVMDWVI